MTVVPPSLILDLYLSSAASPDHRSTLIRAYIIPAIDGLGDGEYSDVTTALTALITGESLEETGSDSESDASDEADPDRTYYEPYDDYVDESVADKKKKKKKIPPIIDSAIPDLSEILRRFARHVYPVLDEEERPQRTAKRRRLTLFPAYASAPLASRRAGRLQALLNDAHFLQDCSAPAAAGVGVRAGKGIARGVRDAVSDVLMLAWRSETWWTGLCGEGVRRNKGKQARYMMTIVREMHGALQKVWSVANAPTHTESEKALNVNVARLHLSLVSHVHDALLNRSGALYTAKLSTTPVELRDTRPPETSNEHPILLHDADGNVEHALLWLWRDLLLHAVQRYHDPSPDADSGATVTGVSKGKSDPPHATLSGRFVTHAILRDVARACSRVGRRRLEDLSTGLSNDAYRQPTLAGGDGEPTLDPPLPAWTFACEHWSNGMAHAVPFLGTLVSRALKAV